MDGKKELVVTEAEVELSTMSKPQIKMWLGEIARGLIYEDGYYISEAAAIMRETTELREAFQLAGYTNGKGDISYSGRVMERWAARAYRLKLNGDKRSVSTMLFTKQLVELLEVKQLVLAAIRKGKLHHIDRFIRATETIGKMMPGHFVGDTTQTMNFTKIVLSDGEKKEMQEKNEKTEASYLQEAPHSLTTRQIAPSSHTKDIEASLKRNMPG